MTNNNTMNTTAQQETKTVTTMDVVRATEKLTSYYGFDVKAAGFNMISKFTIIIGDKVTTSIQPKSITVNTNDILDILSDIEHLGRGLVGMIIELSEVSEFSFNPDINEEIPFDEAVARVRRLTATLEKRGWNPGMDKWDFRQFEEKYPKGYIRCLTRAILEGATGTIKCLSCANVRYLDGGIMKCERTTTSAPTFEMGVPSRLSLAEKMRVSYHTLYTDIICNYTEPCYCMYRKGTRKELEEKHNNNE